MRRIMPGIRVLFIVFMLSPFAEAHHLWVVRSGDDFRVLRGLAPEQIHPYEPVRVADIRAIDAGGRALTVHRVDEGQGVRFTLDGEPALVAVACEWGERVNTPEGKKLISRRQATEKGLLVQSAFSSTRYSKTYFSLKGNWGKPIGALLEILPLATPESLKPGDTLAIQVRDEGAPLPSCSLHVGRDAAVRKTNPKRIGHVALQKKGLQVITAIHNDRVSGHPEIDYRQIMAFLNFRLP